MCCNPANGRLEFEDGGLIKSSFITMDKNESLSADQDQTRKRKKRLFLNSNYYVFILKKNSI
jgi:hypothetical protein